MASGMNPATSIVTLSNNIHTLLCPECEVSRPCVKTHEDTLDTKIGQIKLLQTQYTNDLKEICKCLIDAGEITGTPQCQSATCPPELKAD